MGVQTKTMLALVCEQVEKMASRTRWDSLRTKWNVAGRERDSRL